MVRHVRSCSAQQCDATTPAYVNASPLATEDTPEVMPLCTLVKESVRKLPTLFAPCSAFWNSEEAAVELEAAPRPDSTSPLE